MSKYQPVKNPKTTGRLSFEHMAFIDSNIKSMSVAELAKALNRTPGPIKRYLREKEVNKITFHDDDQKLATLLHKRHYWSELKKQFTKQELEFFEHKWIDYYKQFSSDVTPTEETQLIELIRISVLLNGLLLQRQVLDDKIKQLEDLIDIEMSKSKDKIDTSLVGQMHQQMAGYAASKGTFLKDYELLLNRQEKLTKELKGDRLNRKRKAEDSSTSFASYVRYLESENVRSKEGDYMAILDKAADKARDKLYEYHTYSDQEVDRPILNSQSVDNE